MSVYPVNWGKISLRDGNGKGTMGCGSGLSWGLVWGVRGIEMGDAKTYFSAGTAVYVHCFNNYIREGAPQSGYLVLFVG